MLTLLFSRSEQVPNQSLSKWRDVYQHRSRHIPMWLSCWLHWNELWKRYRHSSVCRHGYVYMSYMHGVPCCHILSSRGLVSSVFYILTSFFASQSSQSPFILVSLYSLYPGPSQVLLLCSLKEMSQPLTCFCLHPGTRLTELLDISTKNYLITKINS